jgi:hypothetical protein
MTVATVLLGRVSIESSGLVTAVLLDRVSIESSGLVTAMLLDRVLTPPRALVEFFSFKCLFVLPALTGSLRGLIPIPRRPTPFRFLFFAFVFSTLEQAPESPRSWSLALEMFLEVLSWELLMTAVLTDFSSSLSIGGFT